jgi:nicotinamidase-related amidase
MTKALIVVDVQESFRQRPNWAEVSQPDIVDQVNRLAEHARANGDRVIWVLHAAAGSGGVFDPDSGHVRLIDGLIAKDGEPTITKTSHNAFTTTNLQQVLVGQGIRDLIVCGIRTEQCCETTARVGSDLGFEVEFAIDATATMPMPHWNDPDRILSTSDIIDRTAAALHGRFATVRTVSEITSG